MKLIPTSIAACALLALFSGLALPSAKSAVVHTWNEPFTAPENGLPTGWQGVLSGTDPDAGTIAVTEVAENEWRLMLRRDDGSNQTAFYTGSQGPIVDGVIENFNASVVLSVTGGTSGNFVRGIVGRAQSVSSSIVGYYAYLRSDRIFISLNAATGEGSSLVETTLAETLAKDTEYQLHFSANGSLLAASVYKKDVLGEFTILLGEVSTMDDTYASGILGLRAAPDGDTRYATFSNLEVEVIPEPSLAWSALAMLGWIGWRQRRKRAERDGVRFFPRLSDRFCVRRK
ncbi:MAG TPA: hypothetical protein VNQ90_14690 [Chthoniobacteraceae bacterium]|nr:hypothetical protein [Chthoniobacteraceae bacterium]